MIWSKSAPMAGAKLWFAPTLGMWRSYKQSNIEVFRLYSTEFFAGLHFRMTPGQPFFLNTKKLSSLLMIFSWTRLAYPAFRNELKSALRYLESQNSMSKAGYRHLKNLEFLCDWFIPVVRYHYYYEQSH
jgi:hypothetical protein